MSLDVTIGGSGIGVSSGQGAKGPPGPPGPQGPKGDKGSKGDRGLIGPEGDIGPRGLQGVAGPQGVKGDTGAIGPHGPAGSTGPEGPRGQQGVQGLVGPQGPIGLQGGTGAVGARGAIGPTGSQGQTGLTGVQGPKGDKGDVGSVGPKGDPGQKGNTGAVGPTGLTGGVGPQGPQGGQGNPGANGPPGSPGSVGPKGDDGTGLAIKGTQTWDVIAAIPVPVTGDTWILSASDPDAPDSPSGSGGTTGDGMFYDGAGWVNVGPIRGPQGPTGTIGPQGTQGNQGVQGPKGDKGDTGNTGATGNTGVQGPVGPQGITGDKGVKGDQGLKGNTGNTGPKGDTGITGPIGPLGNQGPVGPQGPQGFQGIDGPTGSQGVPGPQGIPGVKGDTGDTGTPGTPGAKGDIGPGVTVRGTSTWTVIQALPSPVSGDLWILSANDPAAPSKPGTITGGIAGDGLAWTGAAPWVNAGPIRGPQGDPGPIGPQGIQGVKGDTGIQGVKGDTGVPGAPSTIPGPAGATGPQGSGVRFRGYISTASAFPTSGNVIGDMYLANDTGNAWQWTFPGQPLEVGRIRGDQGIQGVKGDTGLAGANGADGAPSTVPGPQGPPGPNNYTELDQRYLTTASGGNIGMATGGQGQLAIRSDDAALRVMRTDASGGSPFIAFYDNTNVTRYGYLQMSAASCNITTIGTSNPPIVFRAGGTTRMTVFDTAVTTTVPMTTKALTCDALTCDAISSASIKAIGSVQSAGTGGGLIQLVDTDATTSGTPAVRHPTCYVAFYGLGSLSGSTVSTGVLTAYIGHNAANHLYVANDIDGGSVVIRQSAGSVVIQPNNVTSATFAGDGLTMVGRIAIGLPPVTAMHVTNLGFTDGRYVKITSSDYRIKENVVPLTGALDRIMSTRPVAFDLIDTKEHNIGFIAHELADVYPEAVTGVKDGPETQTVAPHMLIPDLVAAIQELQAEVAALRKAA